MAEPSNRKRNTDDNNRNGRSKIKKKSHNDTLEVVCRVAPYSSLDPCILAIDDEYIKLVPPAGINKTETIYKFGCVFDITDSQRAVFRRCAFDFVEDLVNGRNGLLFTYGVTGSGKTFTMTGDNKADKAGILPRSLDVLFNSLPNQLEKCIFYPDGKNGFHIRNPLDADYYRKQTPPFVNEIAERFTESKKVTGFHNNMVSAVFVSYIEIYNEEVYDLLDESLGNNRLGFTKKLRKDAALDQFYVENITEVEVQSSDEALMQFINAQTRRKVGQTSLNQHSSRSHSIFNIRLVMAPCAGDGTFYPILDESKIVVSHLSLVDLAGSERMKRTENIGQRFDEGCNINKSLMTLRRCFDGLRELQRYPSRPTNVPYRESRLTHLFKSFFEGHGRIRMIICINPHPDDYKENVQVLEFAELAQQVDIPEAVAPVFPLSDIANLPFSRRQIDAWHRELEQKISLEPMHLQLFDPPPPFNHIKSPDDEETIRNLREYFIKKAGQHQTYVTTVMQNAQDFSNRLKKRLCYSDLNEKRVFDLEVELEEMRKDNTKAMAMANQYKRQLNAMKLRLNKYECEDFVDRQREEDVRKKQQEMATAMERKSRTLQQAIEIVSSPIFPSSVAITLAPGTSHVAELRRQFGAKSDEQTTPTKKPPVPLPKSAGRIPQTNPQMTMFGKVIEEEDTESSISSLTDSLTSVDSEKTSQTPNFPIIRPKILWSDEKNGMKSKNLHENDWSVLKQPNNLHEINLTHVWVGENFDGNNWVLKAEEKLNDGDRWKNDNKINKNNDSDNEEKNSDEIKETNQTLHAVIKINENLHEIPRNDHSSLKKYRKNTQSIHIPPYENILSIKEPQNLPKSKIPPAKNPMKRKSPELIPFGMAAPKIRRSTHVGPRQSPVFRGSLMTKLPTVVENSLPQTRRYQKNTNTPTHKPTTVKNLPRRRSKSAQPQSNRNNQRKTNDGHESDPEFVKVYKKMEQRKVERLLANERLI